MEETGDEPLFCERAAGIDIGKQMVMVTIRIPSDTRRGGRQQETREFGTTRRQLLALADWLRCWGVERAGMESTSDYWKPAYFLLEREGFDCVLYHASQVRALPGRAKTDKCAWPGGHPGGMKCSRWPAGRGRRIQNGALRVRDKFGAGPAGPWIVASSTNPSFG